MTLKERWTQEDLAAGNLAISGLLVSRVAIPKSEFGNFTASGVEEVEGWAPTSRRRAPFRLGNRDWRLEIDALMDSLDWTPPRERDGSPSEKFWDWQDKRSLEQQLDDRAPHPSLLDPSELKVLYLTRPNGFINLGLHYILDRIFNINTPDTAIDSMGISNDTTTVIATTLLIDPSAGAGSPDFQALAAGVGAAATSRTGNTVTCSSGWEPADFTTVFAITKVGLSTNAADTGDDTTPTVQGVVNIIGGTGGSAPFNEPFTIDLTTVSDFDLTLQQQITAQAT